MKNCPKCNAQLDDSASFCNNCGTQLPPNGAPAPNQQNQQNYQQQNAQQAQEPNYAQPVQTVFDPYDHTSQFEKRDVEDNKLFAILVYMLDIVGVIVALLAKTSSNSPYVAFHIKQSLKFTITEFLVGFITALLCWTCIVPFAAGIVYIIIAVLKIICFFQTCSGKSVEPPIIRSLPFLK